jgi:hypothetical protein
MYSYILFLNQPVMRIHVTCDKVFSCSMLLVRGCFNFWTSWIEQTRLVSTGHNWISLENVQNCIYASGAKSGYLISGVAIGASTARGHRPRQRRPLHLLFYLIKFNDAFYYTRTHICLIRSRRTISILYLDSEHRRIRDGLHQAFHGLFTIGAGRGCWHASGSEKACQAYTAFSGRLSHAQGQHQRETWPWVSGAVICIFSLSFSCLKGDVEQID